MLLVEKLLFSFTNKDQFIHEIACFAFGNKEIDDVIERMEKLKFDKITIEKYIISRSNSLFLEKFKDNFSEYCRKIVEKLDSINPKHLKYEFLSERLVEMNLIKKKIAHILEKYAHEGLKVRDIDENFTKFFVNQVKNNFPPKIKTQYDLEDFNTFSANYLGSIENEIGIEGYKEYYNSKDIDYFYSLTLKTCYETVSYFYSPFEFIQSANDNTENNDKTPSNLQELKDYFKGKENLFNKEPFESICDWFYKNLVLKTGRSGEAFLTIDNLRIFIERSFVNLNSIKDLTLNIANNDRILTISIFHKYYEHTVQNEYDNKYGRKEKYVKLLTENFTNFKYDTVFSNFSASPYRSKRMNSTNQS